MKKWEWHNYLFDVVFMFCMLVAMGVLGYLAYALISGELR